MTARTFPTLDALLAALARDRRDGRIAAEHSVGAATVARFPHAGRTWSVHADAQVERLRDLARAIAAGTAHPVPARRTVRLSDGQPTPAGLYVYAMA